MPRNQFQRMIFALLTVIVTVHSYVFYSLYVVNGAFFSSMEGATGVLDGIRLNGGVMMFGKLFPIWAVVLFETAIYIISILDGVGVLQFSICVLHTAVFHLAADSYFVQNYFCKGY